MRCPYCNNEEIKVVDKRESDEKSIRRRRECIKCRKRFTTYERIESADIMVIKKDGKRERFDRDKLRLGIQKACEKRPISREQIDRLIYQLETELRNKDETEVPSNKVGRLVMKRLRRMDKVAYIRFASVYRDFKDVDSFAEEVKSLKGGRK